MENNSWHISPEYRILQIRKIQISKNFLGTVSNIIIGLYLNTHIWLSRLKQLDDLPHRYWDIDHLHSRNFPKDMQIPMQSEFQKCLNSEDKIQRIGKILPMILMRKQRDNLLSSLNLITKQPMQSTSICLMQVSQKNALGLYSHYQHRLDCIWLVMFDHGSITSILDLQMEPRKNIWILPMRQRRFSKKHSRLLL